MSFLVAIVYNLSVASAVVNIQLESVVIRLDAEGHFNLLIFIEIRFLPNMWSVLEKSPCGASKKVYSFAFR